MPPFSTALRPHLRHDRRRPSRCIADPAGSAAPGTDSGTHPGTHPGTDPDSALNSGTAPDASAPDLPAHDSHVLHAGVAGLVVVVVMAVAAGWLGLLPDLSPLLRHVGPLLAVVGLRASDVTLGVFKTTFTVGGRRTLAASCAAAEAALWVSAAGLVFSEPTPPRVVAFAVGVGLGTLIGMEVVRRLRLGLVTVRAFVPASPGTSSGQAVAEELRGHGFGATLFHGEGREGPVDMVLSVTRRREARHICALLSQRHPDAFVTVDNAPAPGSRVGAAIGSPL